MSLGLNRTLRDVEDAVPYSCKPNVWPKPISLMSYLLSKTPKDPVGSFFICILFFFGVDIDK